MSSEQKLNGNNVSPQQDVSHHISATDTAIGANTQGTGPNTPGTGVHSYLHQMAEVINIKKHDENLHHVAVYLNNVEARDKICRAIQYGSKFISGGADGVANQVDSSTALARKVFRLLKWVNELQQLTEVSRKETGVQLAISTSQHTLMGAYFALDNLVWAGRVGIYKNKRHIDFLQNVALYLFLAGSAASASSELLDMISHLRGQEKTVKSVLFSSEEGTERQAASKQIINKKTLVNALGLARSSLDVAVAFGLLKLAPRTVTPRMTGAFGFMSSLITCYQVFVSTGSKVKTS